MGEIQVPSDALYGAQTQRAVDNFHMSGRTMPAAFVRRLAIIKAAAARANLEVGVLEASKVNAIFDAAMKIAGGEYLNQFPIDVFQTGSGTSTNMNMNEVIAHIAADEVHANDDVNRSQSSNDVIPTCIQISASLELELELLPALDALIAQIDVKASSVGHIVKTGRTHLMDAMPVTFGQELATWAHQLGECRARADDLLPRLKSLPLGGTAVGTGVNCPDGFPAAAVAEISKLTGSAFTVSDNKASRMAAQDAAAECSSVLRSLAIVMMKIANDLRWMGSGPLAGLAEVELKALQPGSSIMPGKVNPVLPEAVAMAAADIMGSDVTIGIAAQSGNFQLNVMLPLIADRLLSGINLMAGGCRALSETIEGFAVNEENVARSLGLNPILVTALNARIGYEAAAAIAKKAYAEGRPVLDVAEEETDIPRQELASIMDPGNLV
jgi:fumarate hydratase class II